MRSHTRVVDPQRYSIILSALGIVTLRWHAEFQRVTGPQ